MERLRERLAGGGVGWMILYGQRGPSPPCCFWGSGDHTSSPWVPQRLIQLFLGGGW